MYISVCAVSCNYMHLQFQIQLYHIFHVQCEPRYVRGVLAPRKTIKIAALRCNGLYEEVCNIQSFLEQLVQGLVDVCMWQNSNSVSYRVWKPDIRRNLGIVAACVGSTLIFGRNHFKIQLWEPSAAQLTWWRPTDWPKSFNGMAGFQLCTSMIHNKTTCSLQFEIDCACVALPDLYIRMQGLDDQISRGELLNIPPKGTPRVPHHGRSTCMSYHAFLYQFGLTRLLAQTLTKRCLFTASCF